MDLKETKEISAKPAITLISIYFMADMAKVSVFLIKPWRADKQNDKLFVFSSCWNAEDSSHTILCSLLFTEEKDGLHMFCVGRKQLGCRN